MSHPDVVDRDGDDLYAESLDSDRPGEAYLLPAESSWCDDACEEERVAAGTCRHSDYTSPQR
jgi:hypothetical protein